MTWFRTAGCLMVGGALGLSSRWNGQGMLRTETDSVVVGPSGTAVVFAAGDPSKANVHKAGKCIEGLPSFSLDEVRTHATRRKGGASASGGVWVTYQCGVYDVSDFIEQHPGGVKRIMLAAGGDIEKFWRQFTIHDDDAVRDILERHRVGNVKGYVASAAPVNRASDDEAWKGEPERSPALTVLSKRPFNAESPEAALEEFITPNDLFFVRNHMPVPDIPAATVDAKDSTFCLKVEGEGVRPDCLRLSDLKSSMFRQHTITNTIQCGGNRRSEMSAAYASSGGAVKGLNWSNGGIGTSTWRGVWLRDVLSACGVDASAGNKERYHVLFEGADKDAAGNFNVSVPLDMALDPRQDCLIAYEMNGEPIPRDHGFPLRAIVPGTVGVRNCKWLQRIVIQPSESQSVWQQQDYKNFPSFATKPDPSLPSVYAMPVQSAVTDASYNGSTDTVNIRGYAYSGGGHGIQRVELSFDGGKSFETQAKIQPVPAGTLPKSSPATRRDTWAWRLLEADVPIDDIRAKRQQCASSQDGEGESKDCYRVCLRAITDDQAVQPPQASYNFRGLLYNGYSCRDVYM